LKTLSQILTGVKVVRIEGTPDKNVASVEFDSRNVIPGSLFVAAPGTRVDGHQYINKSIELGAETVVCNVFPAVLQKNITYIEVNDSRLALGIIAANFFDHPSSVLKLVGVTGTNGKTTIVNFLYALFRKMGYKAGLLSTIENKINDQVIGATHTTPDPLQLNKLMSEMVKAGCEFCFMEVSSHAVDQKRIAGLEFRGGIFTNLTHDHLDYHKTMDNYLKAKKQFFDLLPDKAFALSNTDDKNGRIMLQNTKAARKTYSLRNISDFKAKIIENQFGGLQLNINGKDIWTKLVGEFNAYNILAVYAATVLLGEDDENILPHLSSMDIVEGRFDCIQSHNNITAVVDYAHSPDALKNVLSTIDSIRTNNQTVITVIGAGGDRDRDKRPIMAKIAADMSNKVILTSDNPRSENPENIITDMLKGIEPHQSARVISIVNRREAIKTACIMANPGDIILVAGKGHEKYQEISGVKYPFDDKQLLKEFLSVKPNQN
jgi:UDP-N-acetylmuramoyl-L-alanyl-D-glutamate--2,6-diaminopimelate ligase